MAVIRRNPKPVEQLTTMSELSRQIDGLQRLSNEYRDKVLGTNWFKEQREFYNLSVSPIRAPSFRPMVSVPQLQLLSITEASDLSDSNPKIYIVNKGKRDKPKETALQAEWRDGFVNNQIMLATIWSMLNGNGYIQLGFDPYYNQGRGCVWAKMRDPETVYFDPACTNEDDWHYLIIEDRMYPDEIKATWPETGRRARANPPSVSEPSGSEGGNQFTLEMPPGPMSIPGMGGISEPSVGPSDGRLRVRWTYIFDPTVQDVKRELVGTKADINKIVPASFELKYPNGRLIIDCEALEHPLYDGDNPNPNRSFPLVRILGMPPLGTFQAPPPTRYTKTLQQVAERMFTQTFENAVRLNNGVWFIPEETGITTDDFGGIPGEVRMMNANSTRKPECVFPKPFPPHMLEYPKYLLSLQKELQGYSGPREGKPGAGNVGIDLFDAAVFQSQSLTRMRSKLMAESVNRIAKQFFSLMSAYYSGQEFPDYSGEFKMLTWDKVDDPSQFNLYIDPASVEPISQAALQKLVPALRKEGLLSAKTALEMINIPGAAEESDLIETEKAIEALSKIKKR